MCDCAIVQFLTVWLSLLVVWSLDAGCVGEMASRKRLFNPPSRLSRLGTQCPALMSCHVYVCFVLMDIWGFVNMVVVFIYLSIYLPMAGMP